jgi:hypothetical protein
MSTLKTINVIHPSGVTNNLVFGSSGQIGVNGGTYGTSGQVLTSGGSGAAPSWATLTTGFTQVTPVATTSGTAIDITGIPSTAKVIIINFNAVSTNGSSNVQVQVGYAGPTIVTSGYLGATVNAINGNASSGNTYTTGFLVGANLVAADDRNGSFILTAMTSTLWTCHGVIGKSNGGITSQTGSVISMGGTLDRLRLTTVNGTDAFDAGSWSIAYI